MFLAVVQRHAHVHDGIVGEDAFAERLCDALLDGADVLLGDNAADGLVDEFEACPPRQRLHLEGDPGELAVAARLLLVRVLGLRRSP